MADPTGNVRELKREHADLTHNLEVLEAEMQAGPVSPARGEEGEKWAKRAEEIQVFLKRYNRISGAVRDAHKIDTPTMPVVDDNAPPHRIKTTPGHLFVTSEAFQQWRGMGGNVTQGAGGGWCSKVDVKSLRGGMVPLYGEDADNFKARIRLLETKQYSDALLSDLYNAIWSQRDDEIVRYEEPEILTIRDLLNVVPCTSDSVQFLRHTATNRAAAAQQTRKDDVKTAARKHYLTTDWEQVNVPVVTLAVLSKVTEQDIEDAPRLIGIINNEMRLDVKVEEETELLYGTGLGGELTGLYGQGVEDVYEYARAVAGETLLDAIRKVLTDLRKRRVTPNAVAIDPLDWEQVEIAKGTTDHYIWALVSTMRGPQVWSTRVVQSDAMTNPDTGERRVLVGDFGYGATLYDRHDVRLAVGYVDDDFERNLRTLRAEERIALAVKRPWAFEYITTEAGS